MNRNEHLLQAVVHECGKHAERMNYAYKKLVRLEPLSPEKVSVLNEEEIAYVDQFIYRFAKLQDTIGQKLFKVVLLTLDEDVSRKSAMDIFNRLEQLGIIKDYDVWKGLRELRNELAHEYENDNKQAADKLIILIESAPKLEKYLVDIIQYLHGKGLLTSDL